jgi:hypothetical protein
LNIKKNNWTKFPVKKVNLNRSSKVERTLLTYVELKENVKVNIPFFNELEIRNGELERNLSMRQGEARMALGKVKELTKKNASLT